jgi:hypothetical protein
VAIAEARLQAARDRLDKEKIAKREEIVLMRERIRRFEAGQGPKPVPGQFSFDENRGREVARPGGGWRGPNESWPPPGSRQPHPRASGARRPPSPQCRAGASAGSATRTPMAAAQPRGATSPTRTAA